MFPKYPSPIYTRRPESWQALRTCTDRFSCYLSDQKQGLPKVFGNQGRPARFILDRDGKIVFRQIGSANWDQDSVRRFLRGLLKP